MKQPCGICEWCMPVTGPAAIRLAGRLGFDGIQMGDLGGAGQGFPLLDPRIQELYREAVAESGAVIHSLHTHALTREGGMRHPLDSAPGEEAVHSFRQALRVCRELEIPAVMVASFAASNVANDYDMIHTARMLALFRHLAADAGIRLVYEGVTPLERILWMLEQAGPGIRLCYDILNPTRFGVGNPLEELERLDADLIDHVHLKDAPEDLVGCCPLGTGAGRFQSILDRLIEKGYRGWLIAENYYCQPPMAHCGPVTDGILHDLAVMRAAYLA